MSESCKNCGTEIVLNFCGNCGQKKMKRIDHNYLKDEIQYTLLHTNKGFFYSVKKLVINPGKTAREYIDGIRVNHYKPLLLLFVLSGICVFLTTSLVHPSEVYGEFMKNQPDVAKNMSEMSGIMMKYYSFIMLLTVPFVAFFAWIAFKNWGYNYFENIVAYAYYYSLLMLITIIIIVPVQALLRHHPATYMRYSPILAMLSAMAAMFWFHYGLYADKKGGAILTRTFLIMLMSAIASILLVGLVIMFYLLAQQFN